MSDYTFTSILVIDGKPVAHQMNGRDDLYEKLMGEYGPLRNMQDRSVVSNADELQGWTDIHAGIEFPVVDFADMESGERLDFYILTDPWYIFEVDDPIDRGAIQQYCNEFGLEPA